MSTFGDGWVVQFYSPTPGQRAPTPRSPEDIRSLARAIQSDDPEKQLDSARQLREAMNSTRNPLVQEVLDEGAVPRLVQFLHCDDNPELQSESAWVLGFVTAEGMSGKTAVVEAGAVPPLIRLLSSSDENTRGKAVCVLGNLAIDHAPFRDLVVQHGGLPAVLQSFDDTTELTIMSMIVWAAGHLLQCDPPLPFDDLKPNLPQLAKLLWIRDVEIFDEVADLFVFLSAGPPEQIQPLIDAGVVPRFVQLIGPKRPTLIIQAKAMRVIIHLTRGTDAQRQHLVDAGVLSELSNLLTHPWPLLKADACSAIANIMGGNGGQIQAVIEAGVLRQLLDSLQQDPHPDVQEDTLRAIGNVPLCGSHAQTAHLVQQGALPLLCDLLGTARAPHNAMLTLQALENILISGQTVSMESEVRNPYAAMVEACAGLDKLHQLRGHSEEDISAAATRITTTYFAATRSAEGMDEAPATTTAAA